MKKRFWYIENIYEDDPQQLKNFFYIWNIFRLNYKIVPGITKLLVYPLLFIFLLFWVISIITSYNRPIIVLIWICLVFISLKLLQGIVIYNERKFLRVFNNKIWLIIHNHNNEIKLDYYPCTSELFTNSIKEIFPKLSYINFILTNIVSYTKSHKTLIIFDLMISRYIWPHSTQASREEKSIMYFNDFSNNYEEKYIENTDKIIDWFLTNYHIDISKTFDLKWISLRVKWNKLLLLFPFKLHSTKVILEIFELFYCLFFDKLYDE